MRELHFGRLLEIAVAVALTAAAVVFVVARAAAADAVAVGDLVVTEAWVRPSLGDTDVTVAYMTVHNRGTEADRLLRARSAAAGAVELHTHIRDGDVMRMRRLEGGIDIPPDGVARLAPGGDHMMLLGLQRRLAAGASVPIVLRFERAGEVTVEAPVQAGPPDAAGAGHKH